MENDEFKDREILDGFSVFSHEIRTPINLIYSAAKIIDASSKANVLDAEFVTKYMNNIINNCNKISLMVNNLISIEQCDFVRFESVDLKEFAEKFSENVKIYAEEFDFDYKYSVKCNEEFPLLPLDCMERILLNLITNAVKYNDKKVKKVTFNITEDEDNIYFSIKDNGNGIEEEYIEKVTEKFFRVTQNVPGMGLGLYIVKSNVEKFGGKLEISSKIKKGTEIKFSVPKNASNNMFSFYSRDAGYVPSSSEFGIEFSTLKENL